MTTELEQEFFKVFGVESKQLKICRNINHCPNKYKICNDKCKNWHVTREDYPEITDRKLLEMICVLSQWDADNYYQILANNIRDLKNEILNDCINFKQKLKNKYFDAQIQQLFKGEE